MTIKALFSTTLIGLGLTLGACSKAEAPTAKAPQAPTEMVKDAMTQTPVNAVLIYADWCGSCKVLDPKITALMPEFADKGVTLVTLDYTDKDAEAFYAQADAAGVGTAVRAHLGDSVKTGQLLLIKDGADTTSAVIKKTHTQEQIASEFMTALGQG